MYRKGEPSIYELFTKKCVEINTFALQSNMFFNYHDQNVVKIMSGIKFTNKY